MLIPAGQETRCRMSRRSAWAGYRSTGRTCWPCAMAMPRLTNTPAWRSAASSCPSASARKAGRDTSGVTSAGPLFNRNRPAIKTDEATRVALHAQYEVNLADARNSAEALGQSIALLQRQSM